MSRFGRFADSTKSYTGADLHWLYTVNEVDDADMHTMTEDVLRKDTWLQGLFEGQIEDDTCFVMRHTERNVGQAWLKRWARATPRDQPVSYDALLLHLTHRVGYLWFRRHPEQYRAYYERQFAYFSDLYGRGIHVQFYG